MAYSTQSAVSDGTLSVLPLSIDYLDRKDISVYIGRDLAPNSAWAWVGTTDHSIKFTPAIQAGVEVTIKRSTNVKDLYHNYSGGAQFTSTSLDDSLRQTLMVAQEFSEVASIASDELPLPTGPVAAAGKSNKYARADHVHVGGGGGSGYIGSVEVEDRVGDGERVEFNLDNTPTHEDTTQVYVDSVYQEKGSYAIDGGVLVFSEAPPDGSSIEVVTINLGGGRANLIKFDNTEELPEVDTGPTVQSVLSWIGLRLTTLKQLGLDIGSSLVGFVHNLTGAVTRSVQDKLRDHASLKDFGVVGDGVTDDTDSVLAALATGMSVEAVAGMVIKMSDSIVVDIGRQSFIGNGATLDFTALAGTSKQAVTLVNSNTAFANDLNLPLANKHYFEGWAILGPGKAGTGASFTGDTTVAIRNNTSHSAVRNCTVYGFGTGVQTQTEGYIQTYDRMAIGQCAVGFDVLGAGTNYGERIVLSNSVVYDNALGVRNACPTGAVQLIGCSLDYNLKSIEGSNSSVTELVSTWWECNDAGSGKIAASFVGGSCLTMIGGRVQQNGTTGALAQAGLVYTDSSSTVSFRDTFMFNTKNISNVLDFGSGVCELVGVKSYAVSYLPSRISAVANNRMADGSFETSAVQDLFSIIDDTAAITGRLTGTNLSLALSSEQAHSGTKSLKFQKVAGGAPGSFVLIVPASPGARVALSMWYRKEAAALSSATVFVQTQAVRLLGLKSNGTPDYTSPVALDTFGIGGTDALIDWTKLETGMDRRLPSWANAFAVTVNATSFQGTIYFDDFSVATM